MHIMVPARLHDRGETLLSHAHERMRRARSSHRVHSNRHRAVRPVLEANREGDARRELAMQLRLGGASADGAPRGEVGDELRRDRVKELRADGNAEVGQVAQELPGGPQALVDLEGAVDVRIVDQALPADGCTGFLR